MKQLPGRYETEQLSLTLSGTAFNLVRVTNTDALYAELVAKGPGHEDVLDERIPYWADLWPSALALAEEVLANPAIGADTEVLEIGCGMALPGIAAGKKGARVTLTDYLAEPLEFAAYNWSLNLDSKPELGLLDWRHPAGKPLCEVLLASDIAYEKRTFDFLPQAFRQLVKPGGVILLSEPRRLLAVDFFNQLPSLGFEIKASSRMVSLNSRNNEVNVYEIRQKSV
jgi:predicted nicotinamide N-methyase